AVRYKGNGTYFRSAGSLKRSLKVDLNEFEKGKKLDGVTKLNFHSNVSDPTWMLEPLSYQLYRDAGVPSPRTAYVKVYVTVPGLYRRRYMGLYSLVENIDRHFIQDNFHEKGGAIFKPVGPNLFGYLGEDWSKYQQQYDPKTDLTPAQQKRMIEFCRLISAEPELEFRDRIKGFIDLDEFARFMAMTVCLSSMDSILAMGQNFYVYLHPKSNRFVFIPWDLDNSFGKFRMTGSQEERETLSIEEPWVGSNRFLERMFRVPEFKKLYLARLKEFTDGIFKPERIRKQVEELGVILRPAVRDESPQKLELFDRGLAGDSVPPALDDRGGFRAGGGGFASSPIKPINPFMKARSLSLEEQLAGRSLGSTISSKRNFGPGR
ncbi:MAG TPA: CotH kinase family protein, partial [Candidatus Saccharimonadales bacterium]|nr:CotH kinase family protein [Candidatus Saccharimonadales bacterium]